MKYRKKPVVVEAIQWNGVNLQEIIDFVGNKLEYHICDTAWEVGKGRPQVTMKIKTLEGEHIATEGDYIIKGVHVEFYPCKPDIFKKTYEPATNTHYDQLKSPADIRYKRIYDRIIEMTVPFSLAGLSIRNQKAAEKKAIAKKLLFE